MAFAGRANGFAEMNCCVLVSLLDSRTWALHVTAFTFERRFCGGNGMATRRVRTFVRRWAGSSSLALPAHATWDGLSFGWAGISVAMYCPIHLHTWASVVTLYAYVALELVWWRLLT